MKANSFLLGFVCCILLACSTPKDTLPPLINLDGKGKIIGRILIAKDHLGKVGFSKNETQQKQQLVSSLTAKIRIARLHSKEHVFLIAKDTARALTNFGNAITELNLDPKVEIVKASSKNYTVEYTFASDSTGNSTQLVAGIPYNIYIEPLKNASQPGSSLMQRIAFETNYETLAVAILSQCDPVFEGYDFKGVFKHHLEGDTEPEPEISLQQVKYGGIISGRIQVPGDRLQKHFADINGLINYLKAEMKVYRYLPFQDSKVVFSDPVTGVVHFQTFNFIRPDKIQEMGMMPEIEIESLNEEGYTLKYSFGKITSNPISVINSNLSIHVPFGITINSSTLTGSYFRPFIGKEIPVVYLNQRDREFECYDFNFRSVIEVGIGNPFND